MGIRPFIAIKQDLAASAPNVLESTMRGMLVGPAVQDEQNFSENVNVSASYGTLASILTDIGTSAKTITTSGLIQGANLDFNTLSFGASSSLSLLDFNSSAYEGIVPVLAEGWMLQLDITAGKVNAADLLAKGAEKGDLIDISFEDASTNTVTQRHKIRDFVIDNINNTFTLQLWDEIAHADLATDTVISIKHYKSFAEVKLDILSPLTVTAYGNGTSSYILDNTSNSVDGGFSADFYVYSPVGSPEGVTFSNRTVSVKQLDGMSSYGETKVTVRVIDGNLMNFFVANRTDLSNNVFEVTTSDYVSKLGAPSEKNKLSYAMSLIAKELPGASMKVYVTEDDSDNAYEKALSAISSQENVYSVTPLTDSVTVVNSTASMAKAASSEFVAKYKMAVVGPRTSYFIGKVATSDFSVASNGSNRFTITLTNGGLLSQGVKIGDFLFSEADKGAAEAGYYGSANETYSENATASIESVLTDKQFTVVTTVPGVDLIATLTSGIEIGAINANQDLIDILKSRSEAIGHKNVVSLFPDKYEMSVDGSDKIVQGFYVAGIINAVMAHLPPQQGLSNMSFLSISKIYGSSFAFSDSELDEIAGAGNFVLLQQNFATAPYALRQLTTDTTSLETMEINKVRCLDYATLAFASVLDDYIGKRNINGSNIEEIRSKLESVGKNLISSTKNDILGSVITTYDISDVVIPQGEKDAVNAYVDVETPTSMNKIRLFVSSGK